MTQTVHGPGGVIYRFPDGMSDDDMHAAIAADVGVGAGVEPPPSKLGAASGSSAMVPSESEDWARFVPSALGKGAVAITGVPGGVESLTQHAAGWLKRQIEDPNYRPTEEEYSKARAFADPEEMVQRYEKATGTPFYKPRTEGGKFVEPYIESIPGAFLGGGASAMAKGRGIADAISGGASAALKFGVVPTAGADAARLAAKGTGLEDVAAIGGALLAPTGLAGARRAVTPNVISDARRGALETLRNEGVTTITEGQATGNLKRLYKESVGGGLRGQEINEEQLRQFTGAANRRAGIDADVASPEVIDHAFNRIGGDMDALAARNPLVVDHQMINDVAGTLQHYNARVAQPNQIPLVRNYITEIGNQIQRHGGNLPGEVFQSMRSRMGADIRGVKDPDARSALRDIQHDLDDAMERGMTNPADAEAWRDARRQYRNLLVVEQAATGAGSNTALGMISPSQLRNATVKQGRRAYARGQGDFAGLTRAGEALLKPVPNSGTAQRLSSMNSIGAALSLLPRMSQRARLTAPGRAYLTNQLLPRGRVDKLGAVIAQLLGVQPTQALAREEGTR